MTTGQVTIHNAPRDTDKLSVLGPFMLKTLMQSATKELGIDWGEEQRTAFLRDPINKRAEDVLQLLQQIDSKGGPSQAAPAPAVAAPAPAPKREPVTAKTNGTNGHGTNGVSHSALPDGMAVLANMSEILKEVSESQKGIAAMLGELNKSIKESTSIKKEVSTLTAKSDQLLKVQQLTLGVLGQLAESQLNAPLATILEQVASEIKVLEATIASIPQGK